jgi:type I restriction enzyme S subunit
MNRKESRIGTYPEDWTLAEYSSVAELKHGYQFRTYDFTDEGIKVFKITQIKGNGKINISECDFIDESRLEDFSKYIIQKGDILMALTGATIGKIARYNVNDITLQNYRVGNFIPLDNTVLSKDFLYYFLSSDYFYNQILSDQTQSAQQNIGKDDINKMLLFLPSIDEQTKIANVLLSIDSKIYLLRKQIKTIEKITETLYNAWFDTKELSNKVGDLINLQNGYAFKSKDFQDYGTNRVLKIKNISGGIVDTETSDFVDKETVHSVDEKFKIKTGDVLFAMTGAKIGKMGIIPKTNSELWLNQRVGLFKEKYDGARFLAYLHLKSDYGKDYIENAATGSAQPNISGTGIENCEFPEISKQEIIDYSSQLAPLYEKLIFNLGQIQKLESLRNTLLPKLMNGEVRVETNG